MNSPIPTFLIILFGFVLGIVIFGKFAGDIMSDSETPAVIIELPVPTKNKELLSETIVKQTDELRLKMDIISFRAQVEDQDRIIRKLNDKLDRKEADNVVLERIIQEENKIGGWHLFFVLVMVIAITIWGVIGYQKTFGAMKKSQVLN